MRLNPNRGEYNLYCYCYQREWLDNHLQKAEKGIRFKVINLSYEYPGYTGEEKWAIITDLTEEELIEKYEEIISSYRPFIVLSSMFGSVRADFIRNEDKFSKRAKRSISIFDFSEETEEYHPEIAANDLEEEAISNEMAEQVRDAIAQLKPIQRERLIKYFFEGKSLLQIAAEEGKSYSTVYESYQAALKKLKKIFENTR